MRKPKTTVENFINASEPSKANFKRETFSLNKEHSNLINELVDRGLELKDPKGRRIRLTRSDVVKAGIRALSDMNDEEFAKKTRHEK